MYPLNKIRNVIEDWASVSGRYMYIDGHAPHFRCPKADLARLNEFVFPNRYENNARSTLIPL